MRLDELLGLGSSTVGDGGGAVLSSSIRPAWVGARVVGPALTARCGPGDNLALQVAVAEGSRGGVVVVDASADRECGYWGEVLTEAALARGLAGLVIDGGVRDVEALERLGFPVFAERICPRGPTKLGPGEVGGPVVVGGVEVRPGDLVVADRDGVSVVRPEEADEVLSRARAKAAREPGLIQSLRSGSTTVDLLGLDTRDIGRGWPSGR